MYRDILKYEANREKSSCTTDAWSYRYRYDYTYFTIVYIVTFECSYLFNTSYNVYRKVKTKMSPMDVQNSYYNYFYFEIVHVFKRLNDLKIGYKYKSLSCWFNNKTMATYNLTGIIVITTSASLKYNLGFLFGNNNFNPTLYIFARITFQAI